MKLDRFYLNGNEIKLGQLIGKGGEGQVFFVENLIDSVAKIYYPKNIADKQKKIEAMINAKLSDNYGLVTFPKHKIVNKNGKFVGFIMKSVVDHKPIHELYAPGARKKEFPDTDYRFLVRAALNLATSISQVHNSGCVIGDINHSGFLISKKATTTIIDADSFQFNFGKDFFSCRVGVPEYTPPELQGMNLADIKRTIQHDSFGLAVLIFQLIFLGRHPYAGIFAHGDMPIDRAIKENRFAYSLVRNVNMRPPDAASDLTDIPQPLAKAFEASFDAGSINRTEPKQWISLLSEFEKSLRICSVNDLHYYSIAATTCPWCAMERITGATLFTRTNIKTNYQNQNSKDIFNINYYRKKFDEIQYPDFEKVLPNFISVNNVSPQSIRNSKSYPRKNINLFLGIAAAIICAAIFPKQWVLSIFLGSLIYGISSAFNSKRISNDIDSLRPLIVTWEREIEYWRESSKNSNFDELRKNLFKKIVAYENLDLYKNEKINDYNSKRKNIQLELYLDRFRISKAKISGIGPTRTALLASFGIESASDIDIKSLHAVPGFGKTNSNILLDWRKNLEKGFVFQDKKTQTDIDAYQKINSEILQLKSKLEIDIKNEMMELENFSIDAFNKIKNIDTTLIHAAKSLDEKISDCLSKELMIPSIKYWPPGNGNSIPLVNLRKFSNLNTKNIQTQNFTSKPSTIQNRSNIIQPTKVKAPPKCPNCSQSMVQRIARRGSNQGNPFWGCTSFPKCRGTRPI